MKNTEMKTLTSKEFDFSISEILEEERSGKRPCLGWKSSWNL